MINETKCGSRRCTIEEAEFELKSYRDGFHNYVEQCKSTTIDSLEPTHTRIKTEIDEAHELMASAKKRGIEAWDEFSASVQAALDRIAKDYHSVVGTKQE